MLRVSHRTFLAVTILVLFSAGVSHADTELSLYTGSTSISDANFNVYYFASGSVPRQEHFDASSLIGTRLTHWGDQMDWLGMMLDLSSFTGRSQDAELRIMPLSLLLMFRLSFLRSEEFPRGSLHPYLGIGPSFVYYRYSLDYRPSISEPLSVTSFGTGWPVSAGVTWQFSKHFGLFAEYRYMKFSINDESDSLDWLLGFPSTVTYRIQANIETTQYLGGLCFFF